MEALVIPQTPLALLLYGAALFFSLFDRRYPSARPWFPLLSALLAVSASACSLLMGADLREVAAVLMVFLLLDLGVRG